MKTNVSRKTINTYIYLKNHVINNKSADKQVHMMKASQAKSILKATVVYAFFDFSKWKDLKWLCESLRIDMFRITHTGKSVNIPVTAYNVFFRLLSSESPLFDF